MLEISDSGNAQFTKQEKFDSTLSMTQAQSNDQDKLVFDLERGAFAVADGVGGAPYGTEAAQAACDAFFKAMDSIDQYAHEPPPSDRMLHIAQSGLARVIHEAVAQTGGYTTFTGVYLIGTSHLAYLHAGDSELLLRRDNHIERITSVQHQDGNRLTNYMGGSARGTTELSIEGGLPSVSTSEWGLLRMRAGDRLILATDGVTDAAHRYHTDDAWWIQKTDLSVSAQALANYLVRASPRIDDSEAIVLDFADVDHGDQKR